MKASVNKRAACEGFTLIEILVAITILAMIFSIIFGTFFYTVRNAEEQEERAAIYHRANFILSNISRNVSSAYVPFAGSYSPEDDDQSVFLGTDTLIENSDADSLSAFTTNPRFGTRAMPGETARVSYEVVRAQDLEDAELFGDENNPFVLKCTVEPLLLKSEDEEATPQWSLNIRSLNLEYSDGADWLQEWKYEDQGVLPDAVRVALELADSNGDTYTFSTIAHVEVNTLLEQPMEPPAQEPEETEETEETKETEQVEEAPEGEASGDAPAESDEPIEFPKSDESSDSSLTF